MAALRESKMKSSILYASAAALAALTLTAGGAFAAKTFNSSHSNTIVATPQAEKACTDAGGKVSTRKDGHKVCSINYNASKSNTGN
jgi:hypothetical protein